MTSGHSGFKIKCVRHNNMREYNRFGIVDGIIRDNTIIQDVTRGCCDHAESTFCNIICHVRFLNIVIDFEKPPEHSLLFYFLCLTVILLVSRLKFKNDLICCKIKIGGVDSVTLETENRFKRLKNYTHNIIHSSVICRSTIIGSIQF